VQAVEASPVELRGPLPRPVPAGLLLRRQPTRSVVSLGRDRLLESGAEAAPQPVILPYSTPIIEDIRSASTRSSSRLCPNLATRRLRS